MLGDLSWIDLGYVLVFGYCAAALRIAASFRHDSADFKISTVDIIIEIIISTGMSFGVIGVYSYVHFQKTSLLLFSFAATLAYEPILNIFKSYFINRAEQATSGDRHSDIRPDTTSKQ